jgi:hypothetical protein
MAPRVTPAPTDADNPAGSVAGNSALARRNDWRVGARRFHVGTGRTAPTHDAGYTTAGAPTVPDLSISLLLRGGESIYAGLDPGAADERKPLWVEERVDSKIHVQVWPVQMMW